MALSTRRYYLELSDVTEHSFNIVPLPAVDTYRQFCITEDCVFASFADLRDWLKYYMSIVQPVYIHLSSHKDCVTITFPKERTVGYYTNGLLFKTEDYNEMMRKLKIVIENWCAKGKERSKHQIIPNISNDPFAKGKQWCQ